MKKISEIEFLNYKAFYGSGENNKLKIPNGNNVLIYGENGSGKSSMYEGLKQFLESANITDEIVPARNLRVPEFYEIQKQNEEGENYQEQVKNEIGLKVTFDTIEENQITHTEKISFTNEEVSTTTCSFLRQAQSLNSFLSYRELLKTYLVENPKDIRRFKVQFGKLLIETILANRMNSVTQTRNSVEWKRLNTPRLWYKDTIAERLKLGLKKDVENLNMYLNDLIKYFDKKLKINLILEDLYVTSLANEKDNRKAYYPYISVDLNLLFSDFPIIDDEGVENHLTVLNEARLSSLAISIYLASVITTSQDNFDFKILFLDDIFIGLDMSNRLPLLEILTKYKKAKLEIKLNEASNELETTYLLEENGEIDREEDSFFKDYQIFITTYDQNWYHIARNFLSIREKKKWSYIEFFKDDLTNDFEVPAIYHSKTNLTKADDYIIQHDYRAAAIYLRTQLEVKLKEILPSSLQDHLKNEEGTRNVRTENKNLNDLLISFEIIMEKNNIPFEKFENLRMYKSNILNALSHNDINSSIYKKELLLVKESIEELDELKLFKVHPKLQDLEIRLVDNTNKNLIISFKKRNLILFYKYKTTLFLIDDCNFQFEGLLYDTGNFVAEKIDFENFKDLFIEIEKRYTLKPYDLSQSIYNRAKPNKQSESVLQQLQDISE